MRKHNYRERPVGFRDSTSSHFKPGEVEPGKPALKRWVEARKRGKHAPALPVQIEGRDDSDTAEDEKLERNADDFERG